MSLFTGETRLTLLFAFLFFFIISPNYASEHAGATLGNFQVSQGKANYNTPVVVPPGIAGLTPNISLHYTSQTRNGLVGIGWGISGLSLINRCGTTLGQDGYIDGVDYDSNDKFCLDGQRLVAINGTSGENGTEYRTSTDSYKKIISYGGSDNNPAYFVVWSQDGHQKTYGNTSNSRVGAQGRSDGKAIKWAINRHEDPQGNYIDYHYFENGQQGYHRIERIDYTGNTQTGLTPFASIVFEFETRPDNLEYYHAGSKISLLERLTHIKTYTGDIHSPQTLVRDYQLSYQISASTKRSRLISITECDNSAPQKCKQATNFSWQDGTAASFNKNYYQLGNYNGGVVATSGDFNGDGLTDMLTHDAIGNSGKQWVNNQQMQVHLSQGDGSFTSSYYQLGDYTGGMVATGGDFNGDGLSDFITYQAISQSDTRWQNNQHMKVHLSNGDGTFSQVYSQLGNYNGGVIGTAGDFNGDGLTDLITYDAIGNTGNLWLNNQYMQVHLSNGDGTFSSSYYQLGDYNAGKIANTGDYNGDGLTDLITYAPLTTNDHRWEFNHLMQVHLSNGDGSFTKVHYQLGDYNGGIIATSGDFNGDGLTDLVTHDTLSGSDQRWEFDHLMQVHLSNGDGSFTKVYYQLGDYNGGKVANARDYNGDGLTDLITYATLSGSDQRWEFNHLMQVHLSNGDGSFTKQHYQLGDYNGGKIANTGDYNGDGLTDLVTYHALNANDDRWADNQHMQVHLQSGAYPDHLTQINNGLGNTTSITYKPMTDAAIYQKIPTGDTFANFCQGSLEKCQQPPRHVVSSYSQDNSAGGSNQYTYHYTGLKTHRTQRRSLGFAQIKMTDQQTGLTSTTAYEQTYPLQYRRSQITLHHQTTLLAQTDYQWSAHTTYSNSIQNLELDQRSEKTYDLHSGLLVKESTAANTYDSYGNLLTQHTTDPTGFSQQQQFDYQYDLTQWRFQPTCLQVTRTTPALNSTTHRQGWAYDAVSGLMTQEIVEPDANHCQQAVAHSVTLSYQHDSYGNPTQVSISGSNITSRSASVNYDYTHLGQTPSEYSVTSTNALGHQQTLVFDARFGLPIESTDANQLTTYWDYDDLGRVTQQTYGDNTYSTQQYLSCETNCPTGAAMGMVSQDFGVNGSTTSPANKVFFDQQGRPFLTTTTGFNGQTVCQQTEYDAQGNIERQSAAYFALGDETSCDDANLTRHYTDQSFDVLDRVIQITHADGRVDDIDYDGLTTTIYYDSTDKHQSKQQIVDSQGQLIQVTDALGGSNHYEYNADGQLTRLVDAAGNETTMLYDIHGNKTSMDDPDMGAWQYEYNVLGELTRQTDAKNQVMTFSYDLLGRLTQQTEPKANGSTLTRTWQYDSATNGIGLIHIESHSSSFQRTTSYDSYSRPTSVTTHIDGLNLTTQANYNSNSGRLSKLHLPGPGGNHTVRYDYTAQGYLAELRHDTSNALYWQRDEVNARGQTLKETYGNGVIHYRDYHAATGQLAQLTTGTNGLIQHLSYEFDVIGNLTQRQDHNQAYTERFEYDPLNRLTRQTWDGNSAVLNYSYDNIGNLQSKPDVGNYSYGQNGAGPHAVTTAGSQTYQYDANGNLTHGGGRTLSYNAVNKIRTAQYQNIDNKYDYDTDDQRIRKIKKVNGQTTETTAYLGKMVEWVSNSSGITYKYYLPTGHATLLIEKTSTSQSEYYHHTDHLGSTQAVSDHNGQLVEQQYYDAWGARRDHSLGVPPAPGMISSTFSRGFTGHETEDGIGLINMNARLYDPTLGRFMSADTIVPDPTSTQSFNRYSYVDNNPLSFIDPTGHSASPYYCDDNGRDPVPLDCYRMGDKDSEGRTMLRPIKIRGTIDEVRADGPSGDNDHFSYYNPTIINYYGHLGGGGGNATVLNFHNLGESNSEHQGKTHASHRSPGLINFSGPIPGTDAGDRAAEYWADVATRSNHPLAPLAHIPGALSALWTPGTAFDTLSTLAGGGALGSAGRHIASKIVSKFKTKFRKKTTLPDKYWVNKKAPTQVTPGTRTVNNPAKPSSSGGKYHSTTHYDQFGRQIGQTHRTNHGRPVDHPNPHHHRRNPITGERLKTSNGSRVWPGLFGN